MSELSDFLIVGGGILSCASIGALVLILLRRASDLDDQADEQPAYVFTDMWTNDQPLIHEGATEDWSPAAELESVPRRPIGPDEAAAIELAHEEALWEDQDRAYRQAFAGLAASERRALDDTFDKAWRWSHRIGSGHLEKDTVEVPRDFIDDLVKARGGR